MWELWIACIREPYWYWIAATLISVRIWNLDFKANHSPPWLHDSKGLITLAPHSSSDVTTVSEVTPTLRWFKPNDNERCKNVACLFFSHHFLSHWPQRTAPDYRRGPRKHFQHFFHRNTTIPWVFLTLLGEIKFVFTQWICILPNDLFLHHIFY